LDVERKIIDRLPMSGQGAERIKEKKQKPAVKGITKDTTKNRE